MKVCLYADLAAEGRTSMDICAANLTAALVEQGIDAHFYRPADERYWSRLSAHPLAAKIDVLVQRHFRYALPAPDRYAVHHVTDHSYAHLVHRLPPERTVVTCHDLYIWERSRKSRNPLFLASCKHILDGLARARRVICVSKFTAEALAAAGLAPRAEFAVAYQGVHPAFRPLDATGRAQAAGRFPLPAGPKLIHVGDCHDRKNVELLLDITARLRRQAPVQLIKVGGQFYPHQRERIARLGIGDCLHHFVGLDLEELVALYNLADVLVFPSWLEGFGFPVLEAMACGTPVVATNRSSVPELVGNAGLLADPADAEGFTAAVGRVLFETGCATELARRGRAQAARFTWAEHARQVQAVYGQMLGTRPSTPTP